MGAIYQSMFFLAIALLAISITVFVLAVSLLGRAIRLSVEEQERAEKDRKKDTESEIKKIQDKLEQAKAAGRVDVGDLSQSLQDLERKDSKHKWKLRWIKIKPKLLKVSWGALIPGAFFLTAIVLSALALYWVREATIASIYMWLAVASMLIGICFVCLTLKVIEGVAVTSEEISLLRQKDILKTALKEHEEEKRPKLALQFEEKQPPFHIKAGEQMTIEFGLHFVQGEIARKLGAYIFAPSGFEFPGKHTWVQGKHVGEVTEHVTTGFEYGDCTSGIAPARNLIIKAPSKTGKFKLKYKIVCEGFDGDIEKFNVVVE